MRCLFPRPGWNARLAALALLLLAAGTAGRARAQFAPPPAPAEVPAEQPVNLFAQWEGSVPIDGLFVALPAGWQLEEAVALKNGTQHMPLTVRPSDGAEDEYFIGAHETLRGATEFIFRVRTGLAAGPARWSLEPFTYRAEQRLRRLPRYRADRRAEVEAPGDVGENRVLSFEEGAPPVLLDRAGLPPLSTRTPFTVEAWLKTTGLGEVVLSTWDGVERRPYPLELVIGPAGRLRYYRGQPGRHESMATTRPVADGTWHHVAVAHDPAAGRTRLLVDGALVDSLRGTVPLDASRDVVALGGRVPAPRSGDATQENAAPPGGFTGQLDEVHFWPETRPAHAVRRTMRQPQPAAPAEDAARRLASGETGPVLLHFEGSEEAGWPPGLLARAPRGVERVRSDLRFYAPVTNLRARTQQQAVTLSWAAPTSGGTFVVERSSDGTNFEAVGRREAGAGRQRYTFTDEEASGEIVFYRIRQQFEGGTERLSGTLKVGRGTSEKEGVTLMGNFPNPFSEETTIAYQVHENTHVRLAVWDLTGQRVATLVDEAQGPGYKEVTFRPENLSSGTYFVRLRAGGATHTRKIALLK